MNPAHNQKLTTLINELDHENKVVRELAVRALGELKDERAVEPLIAHLNDPEQDVKAWIIKTLGQIGSEKAIDILIELYKVVSPAIRRNIITALGKIGDERVVDTLLEGLKDEIPFVRKTAAKYLGRFPQHRVVEALVKSIETDTVVYYSAESLAQTQMAEARNYLLKFLYSENFVIRGESARALGEFNDTSLTQNLVNLLWDSESYVRLMAVMSLNKIGDAEALPYLVHLSKNEFGEVWSDKIRAWSKVAIENVTERTRT
jgi:HEAT repeat protein